MLSLPLNPPHTEHEPAHAADRAMFGVAEYRKLGRRAHLRPGPNSVPAYLQRALVDLMTSTDQATVYHDMITATEMVTELISEAGVTDPRRRNSVLQHIADDLHTARRHHPLPPTAAAVLPASVQV